MVWRWSRETDWHDSVECAVGADGGSPAARFLDQLASGEWAEDPDHEPPRDPEQIHDYAKLISKIEFVARYGHPDTATSVNHLDDGVWEFKHHTRRLAYWDTPGDGTWQPKPRHQDIRERSGTAPDGGYWWYPELDPILRLGCGWPKDAPLAPPEKIDEARRLREEDCAHDRPT